MLLKAVYLFLSIDNTGTLLRHVTQGGILLVYVESDLKRSLHGRFIPARKCAPGVNGFELSRHYNLSRFVVPDRIRALIKSCHLVVVFSKKVNGKCSLARRKRLFKIEFNPLLVE